MKFSSVLPLAMAFAAQAAPSPDTAAIQTLQDHEGKTWVGDASAALTARGIEARCDCAPECYGSGHACSPGACQCAGHNGCWSYNGGPFICQIGPNGPAK